MLPAVIPILAPIIGDIARDIIGRVGVDKDKAKEIEAELQSKLVELDARRLEAELKARGLDVDLERALLADRQSARGLTQALASSGSAAMWAAPVLSAIVLLGFFCMLAIVLMDEIPLGSRDTAFLLLGSLASGFTTVVAYWLGSSRSSQTKTDLLAMAPPVGTLWPAAIPPGYPAPNAPAPFVEPLPPPR